MRTNQSIANFSATCQDALQLGGKTPYPLPARLSFGRFAKAFADAQLVAILQASGYNLADWSAQDKANTLRAVIGYK
jgi:hypothetical protein